MLTGQILLQMLVILLAVQAAGFFCQHIGQQWVIGEIIAGLILGPSVLGALFPTLEMQIFPSQSLPTLQTLGDIGLVLYMFALGARLDTHLMLQQSRYAIAISLSSILLPFAFGSILAVFLFPEFGGHASSFVPFLLMVGTSMSITAFPVLARLLTERQLQNTRLGVLALTCSAVDDVIAWCLLAVVIASIHSNGLSSVLVTLGCTVLFVLMMFYVVRPLLALVDRSISSSSVTIALTVGLLLFSAFFTNIIGIHPVFGAFLTGVILPRRATFVSYMRSIDRVNELLFLPLFFVYSGLHTQISLLNTPWLGLVCVVIIVVACAGKIGGGMFSALVLGSPWRDAFTLGVLMNTRGLVELIVLNIGLSLGVLPPTLFAMLVLMALITTMMASPLLPLLGFRHPQHLPSAAEDLEDSLRQNTQLGPRENV